MGGVRSGDFAGLAQLKASFQRLAEPQARSNLSRVLAEECMKLIDDGFRSSKDPYGQPWPPLTSRSGLPLLDTGAHLKNTLTPRSDEKGWTITTPFVGAGVHQYGATIKPKGSGLAGRARRAIFGGARPMLRFKVNGQWVSKASVTIPRRQYMPEVELGPIWTKGLEDQCKDFLQQQLPGGDR